MTRGLRLQPRQAQVFRLGQVVGILQMTEAELDAHLGEAARDNPMLTLQWRPLAGAGDMIEMLAVAEVNSLHAHVMQELAGLRAQGGLIERLIMALIEELEPSGRLGRSVAEIAMALDVAEELVGTALTLVQKRVEPAGLFARTLGECLRLQVEDREEMTPEMDLVLSHLPVLERGGVGGLAQATGLCEAAVAGCLAAIRRLDPKPGARFAADPTLMRDPDVILRPDGTGWEIDLGTRLRAEAGIARLPGGARSPETREALARARALKQALEIRRSALEQVVRVLVSRQDGFFRDGVQALEPLSMAEIAQETGFHPSTVSRVMNGLLIEGPNGVVAARSLISGTAGAGSAHARPRVMARIRALLALEDPGAPLSDRKLVALLEAEGIRVSRRVVSKYRHEIGAATATRRKLSG
ncbi:RNA polymerase sigma-54 factor 2 [Marinibacterium anthonyi]|nr:RNA polymerase sigma-54 factor 2 [Marinibacterium anthonyi]